jgi:hypothetical protein
MWSKHNDAQVALFAQQFEQVDGRWLYRRSGKGEAYPVTAEERGAFIADFARASTRWRWAMVAASAVIIAINISFFHEREDISEAMMAAGIGVLVIFALVGGRRTYYAPARALARRPVAAAALSEQAWRRRWYQQIKWYQLFGAGGLLLIIAGSQALKADIRNGQGLWPLFVTVGTVVMLAFASWQKWRASR